MLALTIQSYSEFSENSEFADVSVNKFRVTQNSQKNSEFAENSEFSENSYIVNNFRDC